MEKSIFLAQNYTMYFWRKKLYYLSSILIAILIQDPLNISSMVIVVRSLVPGGVAQTDGSLVPGDRIMYVNHSNLEHASLDMAVQVRNKTSL